MRPSHAGIRQGIRASRAGRWGAGALALVALVVAAVGARAADAPDPHAVQPERPTLATHAHTVAPGWIEIEGGGEWDRFAAGDAGASALTTTKFGLTSHTQLGVSAGAAGRPTAFGSQSGFADLSLALKWRLLDDAPLLGDFALLPVLKLPTGSVERGTGTGTTDESLVLISSHDVGAVSVDVNLSATVRDGDGSVAPRHATLWAVASGLPVSAEVGWAAEVYGYPGTAGDAGQPPIVAVLTGPTWTPRPWLELDLGTIVPVTGPQPHAFYAGFVWNAGAWPHARATRG